MERVSNDRKVCGCCVAVPDSSPYEQSETGMGRGRNGDNALDYGGDTQGDDDYSKLFW
jgi:hypothetical protein